ncbi:DUF1549 domain-containing protein [bacterium]|nr:DUF1549 domain-containing protein [bacterium]
MKRRFFKTYRKRFLLFALLGLVPALPVCGVSIDFVHQVVPILKEHCSECHGDEKSKGGFSINQRALFLDDEAALPGDAAKSLFIKLIEETDPDSQMPPEKKPRVPSEQISVLKQWVNEGMKWESGFSFGESSWEPPFAPRRPELPPVVNGHSNPVDRIIDAWLAARNLEIPGSIDDSTFLRRLYLDLTGLLPSSDRVRSFLADREPTKRERLVDELLSDDLAYTEHWLTFWNDLLRNDYDGTGFITGGRTQISEWLYDSLRSNKPFDVMVRELVAPPDKSSAGFINGIKWRGTVSAGQTLPIQFSQSLSQSFLGINMKCASCHDSFIDRWTLADAYSLAAIYAEEPLELHRCDKATGEMAKAAWIFPEIGQIDPESSHDARLQALADLMTHQENGRVPRTIVNRLWGQLLGHGIVHPLDAMQTEPWNSDLLDWLASDFQEHAYDIKHTLRRIVTSVAYQSRTAHHEVSVDTADYAFDGPSPKRLTAEQFVDAIWQISGTAPLSWDAPVARREVDPELEGELSLESQWIWGPSADPGPPPHGEKILLRRVFSPAKPLRSVGIIATVDNNYVLYLNGRRILEGAKWSELEAAVVGPLIQPSNTVLIVAENQGGSSNPAGVFCAIRLEFEDGSDEIIMTDQSWQISETVPAGKRPTQWKLHELTWVDPVSVKSDSWKNETDKHIGSIFAKAYTGGKEMARAALFKADDLMRALGRPNRDQIVTSRPSELTTLEAVNLATSDVLADDLAAAAERFLARFPNDGLVDEIYLVTLSRFPTENERAVAIEVIGERPGEEAIADLLWAITMTPEFLIIR